MEIRPVALGVAPVAGLCGLGKTGDDADGHMGVGAEAENDALVERVADRLTEHVHDLFAEVEIGIREDVVIDGDEAADFIAVSLNVGDLELKRVEDTGHLHPDALGNLTDNVLAGGARHGTETNL